MTQPSRTIDRQQAIVAFLAQRPMEAFFASEIVEAVDVPYGKLYPALAALERRGEVQSDWQEMARPRRRVYWVKERDE